MSQSAPQRSLTASDIRARKGADPLVCLVEEVFCQLNHVRPAFTQRHDVGEPPGR